MRVLTAREQVELLSPWRTASSRSLYRGLEQPHDPNYDTNKSDSATGYSTWTDNPALARQYAGNQGYVYRHDFPSHLQTDSFINDDGDRGLFYNNEKPAGLNGVTGDEYQVYHHHEDYDPSGMTLHEGPIGQPGAYKRAMSEIYDEYAGHHQSPGPGTGFPIHNMHGEGYDGGIGGVPEDWQTHPQYYAHSSEAPGVRGMKQTQQMYNRVNGRPDEMVDIYRALPHGNTSFNTGDWVTPSLAYAKGHAMSEAGPEGDLPVIKSTVPAKHLWQNGDSYYEMGYHGPGHQGTVV